MNAAPRKPRKTRSPVEAEYILEARRYVVANREKNLQAREEAQAKKLTVQAMHSVNVSSFDFTVGNASYSAILDRPTVNKINVKKLYVLVKQGDITLDEFLDCISAPQKAVEDTLGKAIALRLTETKKRGIDLIITLKH